LKATGEPISAETILELAFLRGLYDLEFFANFFFEDKLDFPFSKMHYDFFETAKDPFRRGLREAIAAPRGHAKTFLKLRVRVIHAICYQTEHFVLVLGHSLPDAEDKVAQIREELENNPRIKAVFGDLAPVKGQKRYRSRKKFVSASGVMVMARSKGQSIRGITHEGKRPSLIIFDDVESLEEVRNPEQRQKTKEWFNKDILKLGQLQGQTNITIIGTCLHPESLLTELLGDPGWTASRYQAVISYATNHELWEHYRQILTNLSDSNRVESAIQFYKTNETAMMDGTEVLWPEGEPYEYLMRIRILEGDAAFNSEKQNEPYDPQSQMFDMKSAHRFKWVYENGQVVALKVLQTGKVVPAQYIEKIIAFHDPAYGKDPTKRGDPDYACIVVAARDEDGYIYVLDVYLEKDLPDQQIKRMLMLYDKWGFETLYFESNGGQCLMGQLYKDAVDKRREPLQLRWIPRHETSDKTERISLMQPDILHGQIIFAEDLSPRFYDQMTYFPTGTYKDGPDALHGAWRELKKRPNTITMIQGPQVIG
jgi:predicted phage terminase large subunit-like protein